MIQIEVKLAGDEWYNREQLIKQINAIAPTESVVFTTLLEGVSLKACGVIAVIDQWIKDTNRDPSTVYIDTPNQYEQLPYKFVRIQKLSHFFKSTMIKYHVPPQEINPHAQLFGCFVGRYTEDRNQIIKDALTSYQNYFLLSVMGDTRGLNRNRYAPEVFAVGSIDNKTQQEQYQPGNDVHASLLKFYNQFQIEIVAETMTRGETFFVTEKTVRPLMGSKPMLIFGPKHYLANLRTLGFKTFSDLWSEEYDNYEGPERWTLIKQVIDGIINKGYDCKLAQDIVYYNYMNLLKTISND